MMRLKPVLVFSLSALFICLLLLSFFSIFHSPKLDVKLSWHKDRGWLLGQSSADPPFFPGDIIRSVNGINVGFYHFLAVNDLIDTKDEFFSWLGDARSVWEQFYSPEIKVGVLRDNQLNVLTVTPEQTRMSFLHSLSFFSIFIISAVFFGIGIITFSRMPVNETGIVFLAFCTAFAATLFTMSVYQISADGFVAFQFPFFKIINIINLGFYFLSGVFLFHLSLLLPRKRRFARKGIIRAYYVVNFAIAAFFHLDIMFTLFAGYILLSILMLIHGFFAFRSPIDRQQMKWVLAGFGFGFGPWLLLNGIPVLLHRQELLTDYIPALFTVCIPLFMAFSIRRYKLFYIDVLFEGTLVYGVTLVLLFFIDIGLTGLISTRLNTAFNMTPSGKAVISTVLIVLCYAPIRDRIQFGINQLFRKNKLDESKLISEFNQRASGKPPEKILSVLKKVMVENFRPQTARIVSTTKADFPENLFESGIPKPVLLWENKTGLSHLYPDTALALPVFLNDTPRHLVLMGYPESGKLYTQHHLSLLNTLLIQANLLYNNAALFADNIKQTRARLMEEKRNTREKEKILRDLHDGIGGISTNINLLAQMGKHSESVADTREMFDSISALSQESLFEIRSFFHSLDAKETNWDEFISELNYFAHTALDPHDIKFKSQSNVEEEMIPCDSLVFLILFRIYKEGLANVIKHAKATEVLTTLSVSGNGLELVIHDNGSGIPVDHRNGRGLFNMTERARELGGSLKVEADSGTTLTLEVPLPVNYVIQDV